MGAKNKGLTAKIVVACLGAAGMAATLAGQTEHGRKWKPLPDTAHIEVTVEKGFNGKPLPNAAVVFHATREGRNDGNLEVKTDPEGKATIDVIEVGSHVTIQVIANGFATSASEMDVDGPSKELLVKLQRPQAQISTYQDNDGKAAQMKPGVQEHHVTVQPQPVVHPAPVGATPVDPNGAQSPAAVPTSGVGQPGVVKSQAAPASAPETAAPGTTTAPAATPAAPQGSASPQSSPQ